MLGRRFLVLVLAASSACAHATNRRANEDRLAAINFEGNHWLSDKTLRTGLALGRVMKRGGSPDPYLVQVDADRIRGEYMRAGYLDVDVRSRVERKGETSTVIYTVEEGLRANTRIAIRGLPQDFDLNAIREQLPLKDGHPFVYEIYDEAKPKLLGVVQDAGYAHAKLDASVIADRANHSVVVDLDYTPGPKATFGQVEITGAKGALAEAVDARIAFDQGQQYSAQAIIQTQRNLYALGRFSTVQVQPDKSGSEVVGVKVAVAESASHEVRLGGGLGIDPVSLLEVRGRAGYSVTGWPFEMDTTTVELRPAYALLRDGSREPRIRALAKLERQDLLWTYAKGTVEAGYNYLTVEAYTSYGPLARLGFETRLGTERVRLRVGWGIEHVDFRRPSPAFDTNLEKKEELGLNHSQQFAAYEQALIVDLRNHPIEPTLGAYGEIHVSEGTQFAGSNLDYFAMVPDARAYLPLLFGAVLAGHVRYGAIYGDVPVTERFFSGGTNSQRGFAERKLAPFVRGEVDKEVKEVAYGGAGLIETNVEVRMPITKIKDMPLGAAVFLDGADVTDKPEQLDPSNLHWAVGAGLRLMTVVGPVRLDVGYRLNRKGEDDPANDSSFAYHLTIGEAF